ncbi:MAG: hypothetical protein ACI9JY_002504 [Saprospiraceae bacterium]|jgi:hypothetical protein
MEFGKMTLDKMIDMDSNAKVIDVINIIELLTNDVLNHKKYVLGKLFFYRYFGFIFIFLVLAFTSCTNQDVSNQNPLKLSSSKILKASEIGSNNASRLNFTTMIYSIFEDSDGNMWFGSDREGVCRFDGKSYTYFSMEDGLSHSQIRLIQGDGNGNIWFGTGNGLSQKKKEWRLQAGQPCLITRAFGKMRNWILPNTASYWIG